MRLGGDRAIFQADAKQAVSTPPLEIPIWAVYLMPHYGRKYPAAPARPQLPVPPRSKLHQIPAQEFREETAADLGKAGRAQHRGEPGEVGRLGQQLSEGREPWISQHEPLTLALGYPARHLLPCPSEPSQLTKRTRPHPFLVCPSLQGLAGPGR